MAGMVFDTGMVMDFKPMAFVIETWKGSCAGPALASLVEREEAIGWATVVTHRDSYVVDTEVQPMIVCCGGAVPALAHLNSDHRAAEGSHYWWRMGS